MTKNIGAHRFNQVYKQGGRPMSEHSDEEILTILLGDKTAARSVLEEIGGGLEGFSSMREGRRMLHCPGVNKGRALKLDALFEAAVRIR